MDMNDKDAIEDFEKELGLAYFKNMRNKFDNLDTNKTNFYINTSDSNQTVLETQKTDGKYLTEL